MGADFRLFTCQATRWTSERALRGLCFCSNLEKDLIALATLGLLACDNLLNYSVHDASDGMLLQLVMIDTS